MSSCASSEPFALQVTDNSMEPEFPDKCIIIIDPFPEAGDGAFVVAEYDDVRWFRQFRIIDGRRYLMALNDLYPEIELVEDYTILGLVVQRNVRRKIKHYPMGLLAETAEERNQVSLN
ncbi:MAG: S24 family peptidase [Chromatiales bacterium]|nr:S24 family peptidase [Chromatiales bacterium]